MAVGLSLMIIFGLLVDYIVSLFKLPGLIGLLFLGMLFGPYGLNIMSHETLDVSADWRMIALVVILLRAGFELSRKTLQKVGVRALMLSFIPCLCEISVITLVAPLFLNLNTLEAAMLGSILGAVSPAVVVPLMIKFMEEKRGAEKGIPTLVLAGSSCDDAVAIVVFTSVLGIYLGSSVSMATQIASIPISVITGIGFGALLGFVFYKLFSTFHPRATKRIMLLIATAIIMVNYQDQISEYVPFAALISIMTIGFVILEKNEKFAHDISSKLGKVWIFAQILLFVYVGMQVNVPVAVNAGLAGAIVITCGLLGRSVGVFISLLGSDLNLRERVFVAIAYTPKATVQAAIGATPLLAMQKAGMNTDPGQLILAISVLAIILTAPLGAIAISHFGEILLSQDLDADNSSMEAAILSD